MKNFGQPLGRSERTMDSCRQVYNVRPGGVAGEHPLQRRLQLRQRAGFSMVEVVLVFVIVSIVCAIALPALLRSREAAAKTRCINNLRQLGIALVHYAEMHGSFPSGRGNRMVDGKLSCVSAHVVLLPFLDQSMLARTVSAAGNFAPETSPLSTTWVGTFLCPAGNKTQSFNAVSNYAFNSGTTTAVSPRNPRSLPIDGVFFENSAVRVAEIEDGASYTIAISESLPWPASARRSNSDATFDPGVVQALAAAAGVDYLMLENYDAQCPTTAPAASSRGKAWGFGAGGGTLYNHIRTPNSQTADCEFGNALSGATVQQSAAVSYDFAARSGHPGGVNVCGCDGSVRFIRNVVDAKVWKWLGSKNDGEIIDLF